MPSEAKFGLRMPDGARLQFFFFFISGTSSRVYLLWTRCLKIISHTRFYHAERKLFCQKNSEEVACFRLRVFAREYSNFKPPLLFALFHFATILQTIGLVTLSISPESQVEKIALKGVHNKHMSQNIRNAKRMQCPRNSRNPVWITR